MAIRLTHSTELTFLYRLPVYLNLGKVGIPHVQLVFLNIENLTHDLNFPLTHTDTRRFYDSAYASYTIYIYMHFSLITC